MSSPVLPCVFDESVLCSHRKSLKVIVTPKCSKCVHYAEFVREMEKEEKEFWDEVDRVRGEGSK